MRRALPSRDPLHDPEPLIARVYSYVAYRIGDGPEAEDVTSETFARAVRYRDTYDPNKGTAIVWLIGIARRCLQESLSRPHSGWDPPDRADSRDMASDAVERLTVQAAVGRLGERDRDLLALRYGADLSAKQIAERLELSTSAVEVGLHRARSRLRAAMEEPWHGAHAEPLDDLPVRNSVPSGVRGARRRTEGTISDAILEARRRPRS